MLSELSPPTLKSKQLGTALYMLPNRNNSTKGNSVPSSPKSIPRRSHLTSYLSTGISNSPNENSSSNVSSQSKNIFMDTKFEFPEHSVQEITDIPKHYLDQSEVLKHLAKEVHHHQSPGDSSKTSSLDSTKFQMTDFQKYTENKLNQLHNVRKISEEADIIKADGLIISHSHPDLTNIDYNNAKSEGKGVRISELSKRPKTHGRPAIEGDNETNHIIQLLSTENASLKNELDMYYRKVAKLEKFELEIQKVYRAHEDLIRSSEKREKLERAVRTWLEIEIQRLSDNNKELKEKLEATTSHFSKRTFLNTEGTDLQREIGKKEILISQLLSQNKELLAEKERQEIELQAQRVTLQEQRNHIDILDSALTNAQLNVVKLEEDCRKKQSYIDHAAQLQKALVNVQQTSEKRVMMEKKIRSELEKEIEDLKIEKKGMPCSDRNKNLQTEEELRKTIREYEEKIVFLESEVTKWEQCYLEESTMRQIAVDAASVPKDAKIAALEKTSQESEKLIAQARSEKLKHMDELYAAQRKCAELEGRVRDLESKLAERDAMIKVLQQHSQEKDAVLQNAVLGRPPRHHIRAASTMGLTTSTSHSTTTTGTTSLASGSSTTSSSVHHRTGSKDCIRDELRISPMGSSSSNKSNSPSSSLIVNEPLLMSKKKLDEQLKELDSRLFNKIFCCKWKRFINAFSRFKPTVHQIFNVTVVKRCM
ncbi:angiomotin-like [Centruroides sculpturatus]|uniref:angiomotin-like n=1 Tax=Centruroides sculpturatus TaxID=218467 RepID=UPI000C6DD225|nr:angiomotin-like [Centruroides sculpturatus]